MTYKWLIVSSNHAHPTTEHYKITRSTGVVSKYSFTWIVMYKLHSTNSQQAVKQSIFIYQQTDRRRRRICCPFEYCVRLFVLSLIARTTYSDILRTVCIVCNHHFHQTTDGLHASSLSHDDAVYMRYAHQRMLANSTSSQTRTYIQSLRCLQLLLQNAP